MKNYNPIHFSILSSFVLWAFVLSSSSWIVVVAESKERPSLPTSKSSRLFRTTSTRDLQEDGIDDMLDCGPAPIQSYFIVDLIGFPRKIESNDFTDLSSSFVRAYKNIQISSESSSSCLNISSATVVTSPFASISNEKANTTTNERDFSILMEASGSCQGCQEGRLFMASSPPSPRRLADNTPEKSRGLRLTSRKTQEDQNSTNSTTTCPSCTAMPSRNRVLAEWRQIYQSVSTTSQSSGGAITSIFDITEMFSETDETPACDPSNFTRFGTTVLVTLNITSTTLPTVGEEEEEVLSTSQLSDLSHIFQESYNAVNELNSNLCDPKFRRMSGVLSGVEDDTSLYAHLISDDPNTTSLVHVHFYVGGQCQDCTPYTNVFDDNNNNSPSSSTGTRTLSRQRRRRHLQQDASSSTTTSSCLCPTSKNVQQRGPTEEEFQREFVQATQDLDFINSIVEVNEVQFRLCSDDVVEFNQTILLDIDIDDNNMTCTNGDLLLDADIQAIEDAFVASYNELAETLCDPYLRILDSASLVRRSSTTGGTTTDGKMTLEMNVFGRCRGCDPDDASIYDYSEDAFSTPPIMMVDRRSLASDSSIEDDPSVRRQRRLDTCYCDTTATQERAPTEAEFISFFSDSVTMLAPPLSCLSSVAGCQSGSPFETAIVASFANQNETEVAIYVNGMEIAFMESLGSLYLITADECNPEFRMFRSVNSNVGVPFQPRDFGFPVDRRMLLNHKGGRTLQGGSMTPSTAPGTSTNTSAPTFGPTSQPSESPSTTPSTAPTFIDTDTYVLFYSSGICNGCQGMPIISTTSSRQAPVGGDAIELNSQCYCPIDAEEVSGPFAPEALEETFQAGLVAESVPLDVRNVYEVNVVDCEGDMEGYETSLYVNFAFNETLSRAEGRRLTRLVEETYQNLSNRYCDPLRRELGSLTFEDSRAIDLTTNCSEFQFRYNASGVCQGCETETGFLDESAQERRGLSTNSLSSSSLYPGASPRHLRFEGDDLCFCDQTTIAPRAPTPKEFEGALAKAMSNSSLAEKVCMVSVPRQNIETSVPTASPTEKVCNVTLPDKLSSRVLVTVQQSGNQSLSDEQKGQLGDELLTTYNSIIDLKFTPCDLEYRLVSNVTVDTESDVEEASGSILFAVEVDCQGCAPDSDLFNPAVLARSNFEQVYTRNVDKLFSVGFVEDFREIDLRSCPSDTLNFSRVVRMEFTQLPCMDGLNFTGSEPQLRMVEDVFVSSYNRLALSYCDPFYRVIENAEIVRFGENTTQGNLPLEIRVNGTCRGCNTDEIDVYAIPASVESARRLLEERLDARRASRRQLQDIDTCFCDSQALGERAPFEAEFVAEYRKRVESLQLDCIGSVGQCDFGTRFTTGIVVQFGRDALLESGNVTGTIEETFQSIINDIYEVDEDTCNPEFRVVESVQATIGVNITTAGGNFTGTANERMLQTNTGFPSASPIALLTDAPAGSPGNTTSAPTSSPTIFITTSDSITVLLYVSGFCNGCANDFQLSNQVTSSRRDLLQTPSRELQDGPFGSTSNCFCPIEATLQVGPVETNLLTRSFQAALDEQVDLTVQDLDEITVVECIDEMRDFETDFTFTFAVKRDITDREIDDLATLVADTYNTLNAGYCDPFLREIDELIVADSFRVRRRRTREMQEDDCFRLDIEFNIFGSCRGCRDFIDLFDDDGDDASANRRRGLSEFLLDPSSASRGQRRGLQDFDVCFCEGETIASRAPTFDEFALVFEPRLEALGLPNVCGFFAVEDEFCDVERIGEEYASDVDVSLVIEGNVEDLDISALEELFFETFNGEIDSSLSTCDMDYTQLFFVAVDDIIAEESRALQEFREGEPRVVTVTFVFFGYCQAGSACDGEIVFDVIDDITDVFEDRVEPILAAGKRDVLDFVEDPILFDPFLDGEDGDGEFLDGEDGDGEFLDGEDGDGEFLDGEDGDGSSLDGEDGDGLSLDGEDGDGLSLDGEDGDGPFLDGEESPEEEFPEEEFPEEEFPEEEFPEEEFPEEEFPEEEFPEEEFPEEEFPEEEFPEEEFPEEEFPEEEFPEEEFAEEEFPEEEFAEEEFPEEEFP